MVDIGPADAVRCVKDIPKRDHPDQHIEVKAGMVRGGLHVKLSRDRHSVLLHYPSKPEARDLTEAVRDWLDAKPNMKARRGPLPQIVDEGLRELDQLR